MIRQFRTLDDSEYFATDFPVILKCCCQWTFVFLSCAACFQCGARERERYGLDRKFVANFQLHYLYKHTASGYDRANPAYCIFYDIGKNIARFITLRQHNIRNEHTMCCAYKRRGEKMPFYSQMEGNPSKIALKMTRAKPISLTCYICQANWTKLNRS